MKVLVDALEKGHGKYRNIMIVGPANCGKTFPFNPLNVILHTFLNLASTMFAWVGAKKAKCIFLNEFRWSPEIIPWHDLLIMLQGQTVHLPAYKTRYTKDLIFERDTPIFSMAKHTLIFFIKKKQSHQHQTD